MKDSGNEYVIRADRYTEWEAANVELGARSVGPALHVGDVGEDAETDTRASHGAIHGSQGRSCGLCREIKVEKTSKPILAIYEAGTTTVIERTVPDGNDSSGRCERRFSISYGTVRFGGDDKANYKGGDVD